LKTIFATWNSTCYQFGVGGDRDQVSLSPVSDHFHSHPRAYGTAKEGSAENRFLITWPTTDISIAYHASAICRPITPEITPNPVKIAGFDQKTGSDAGGASADQSSGNHFDQNSRWRIGWHFLY